MDEAIEEGYEITERPEGPMPELVLLCPKEQKCLCLFYDKDTGHIAGLNIGIRKDAVYNATFDWEEQGWTDWEVPSEDGNTVSYLSIQQFYCSPEFVKKTPEERIASRKANKMLPENAIWLSGFNKHIDRISTSQDEVLRSSGFTEQGFVPFMGKHQYYNMSSSTECSGDKLYPWFTLCDGGKVIGTGLMIFGNIDDTKNGCNYFEEPSKSAVEFIVNKGPKCLYDLAEKPGVRTMHIYYMASPWTIVLPFGK
ncbi:uncharacterized protein LOC123874994 [Maniola jurtina]|uniref:uncharacterized protein LOC123874994 n=1 Tax=Maniola jurtina TaxID=191418 RepID=UPI001E688C24|nr:uncharacterized protein LOC123874994 [Maniola jurtina]